MSERFTLTAAGHRLEAVRHGPPPDSAPTIVMLHEGLGWLALMARTLLYTLFVGGIPPERHSISPPP